jgi:hypothetical protein
MNVIHDPSSQDQPVTDSSRFLAALAYAKRGWPVLPLAGKIPRLRDWPAKATTEPRQIEKWWGNGQSANVGIATGKASGILVLDVDPAKGGDDSLRKLEEQYGSLPITPQVLTGGGGQHHYLQHPGTPISNSAGKLGPGLDIRADGGQVVAPPSIHPETGRPYEWEVAHHPEDVPLAPVPDWLLNLLISKLTQETGSPVQTYPEGTRNDSLTRDAGRLRRLDLSEDAMCAALLAINQERCQPPLSEQEVKGIVASVARYPAGSPSVIQSSSPAFPLHPDASPFPMEALPPVIRRYVQEAAAALPIAIAPLAVAALVCLGTAIGARFAIRLKPGWEERPSLYAALILPTGALKSPALKHATGPVKKQQRVYAEQYHQKLDAYNQDLVKYERTLSQYKHRKDEPIDPPGPPPKKPIMWRTWTADVTVERCGALLNENPEGFVIIRDELTAWVKSWNQYKGGKGADRQFYLSLWSGASHTIDRQGKDPIILDHPFVGVVGCLTPSQLSHLNDNGDPEDGLLQRLLFVVPEQVPIRWTDAKVSEEAAGEYHALFETLYALPWEAKPDARVLELSTDAARLFVQWHDHHCTETESPVVDPALRGYYAKLKGYCPRLALIHALCLNPKCNLIEEESVAAAADLIEYFKRQVARLVPYLKPSKKSGQERCEDAIRRALKNGRILTKRQLCRLGNAPATTFNPVFQAMLETGTLIDMEKQRYRLAEEVEGETDTPT